jgi:hypothetical protein
MNIWMQAGRLICDAAHRPLLCENCPCGCCPEPPENIVGNFETGPLAGFFYSMYSQGRELYPPELEAWDGPRGQHLELSTTYDCAGHSIHLFYGASDWPAGADLECRGPRNGLTKGWYAAFSYYYWVDDGDVQNRDAIGTLVSATCNPFEVVFDFPGILAEVPGCAFTLRIRFTE